MAESFNSFFNSSKTFGLNIKVPTRTLQQAGKTLGDTAGGVFEPLFSYLEENENVFSGDITKELSKTFSQNFNMNLALNIADEKANGPKPTFDTKF
ncbi:MAG: hypothetical protein WCY19_07515 [Candidatus Gastranaerophilaceae bacterium]